MTPTITAVVAAYNAERWIGETLEAILGQTRPPDEVVVVDDGSTDATAAELARFGDAIRVVTRRNGGCPAAFNTAFAAARGDYVAMCGADDVWEPQRLEWQLQTLAEHPEVDVCFGGARTFGADDWEWPAPGATGLLDGPALAACLYRSDIVCASSILIRRALAVELGPFVERFEPGDTFSRAALGLPALPRGDRFSGDDYDYWMRALERGATFHHDARTLVRYRRHDGNVTGDRLWVHRSICQVQLWHAAQIADRGLVRAVRATGLRDLGRLLVDAGAPREARRFVLASLRLRPSPTALAWLILLTLPERPRRRLIPALVALRGRDAAALQAG
jgi:glycosyltransferase involved in cell wall biosynthesis